MESKKLFADEFPFQSLWKLGQFIIILQWSEIHFVKCCVFFPCMCVVSPLYQNIMESFVLCRVVFDCFIYLFIFFLNFVFPA